MAPTEMTPSLRIALVEDNEHDVIAFQRTFQKSVIDTVITHFERGEDALQNILAKPQAFDIAVIDYKLPGISGLELCKALLEKDAPLPLVILTGAGSEILAVEALKLGVYDYMIKDRSQGYLDLLPISLLDIVNKHNEKVARQKAEEALKASEERFRLLIEALGDGFVIFNAQGNITFSNERLSAMLGYAPEELAGQPLTTILPQPRLASEAGGVGEVSPAEPTETALQHKDGQTVVTLITTTPLVGEGQEVVGGFAVIRDITELKRLRERLESEQGFEGLVGQDVLMLELYDLMREIGAIDAPVLIQGAMGTGKAQIGRALHNLSPRKAQRCVIIDCMSVPDRLLEGELFGFGPDAEEKGGAPRKSRLELAHGGTVVLKAIEEANADVQKKLLALLESGMIAPTGAKQASTVDVRVITTTRQNLEQSVAQGEFREDLYHKLARFVLHVPALSERKSDLALLAEHFIDKARQRTGAANPYLSPHALARLKAYRWPGNVAELQNAMEYALIKCQGEMIEPWHLPSSIYRPFRTESGRIRRRRKITVREVTDALVAAKGNKLQAAKILGVSRSTLYRFINERLDDDLKREKIPTR